MWIAYIEIERHDEMNIIPHISANRKRNQNDTLSTCNGSFILSTITALFSLLKLYIYAVMDLVLSLSHHLFQNTRSANEYK